MTTMKFVVGPVLSSCQSLASRLAVSAECWPLLSFSWYERSISFNLLISSSFVCSSSSLLRSAISLFFISKLM
uniref:Putative secreted peptide n=1 Tax=Anopheles braziliensis TaxID=58242 RepID=A0A2M3ZV45_9DIPT